MSDLKDKIKELKKPLSIKDIDFRVQSVSVRGFVTILAYKDARVDMKRLDEVVGALNWKREHSRDNKNCTVSIWDDVKKQWVSKEDTGKESFSEKEKGLASDSFKRACFNWGIGVDLYDYPYIFFQLYPEEFKVDNGKAKTTFDFKLKKWKWNVELNDNNEVIKLTAFDEKGRLRYDSEKDFNGITNQKKPQQKQQPQDSKKPLMDDKTYSSAIKSSNIDSLKQSLTYYQLTNDQLKGITKRLEELNTKNKP